MEIFGEWFLQYRTEEDLINLALAANIPMEKISVEKEPLNVNLFLSIIK